MKIPHRANLALAAATALLLSAALAPDAEAQIRVHPLKLSVGGVAQGLDADGDQVALRVRGRDRDLANLAQGFPTTRKLPKGEILALLLDCASEDGRIVVYDKVSGLVLAQLTTVIDFSNDTVLGEKNGLLLKADMRGEMTFNDLPDGANSIEGGQARAVVQIRYADFAGTQCPSRVKGVVVGTIGVTVDAQFLAVLFGKGKLIAAPPVGVVGIL